MTEIRFYHLQNQSLEKALPALLSKAWQNGHRIVVQSSDSGRIRTLNDALWTYNPNSFLPHGTAAEGNAEHQPVWLTDKDENPNNADLLILLDGQDSNGLENYAMVCEMFDGRDENAVRNARRRWKSHKDKGLNLTYWQQNDNGGWDKKT